MINNFMPKRNFTNGFDRFLQNMLYRLPNGNIGYLIVFLNSFFYFLYVLWPRSNIHAYLNNFTLSGYNISKGYLHAFFTAHFTHMSFFSYLIDSVILWLFCNNMLMMYGPLFLAKTVILAMFLGNFLLFL